MEGRRSVALELLLQALDDVLSVDGPASSMVHAVVADSRRAGRGSMFVALRGLQTDGHRFVAQAVERGATAVVTEEPCEVPPAVTSIVVRDSARALSQLAAAFYGRPSDDIAVAGVTGTNGKTTATHMIAAILNAAGMPCGLIGTIGAAFDRQTWPLENTTPPAPQLQDLLAQMRDSGARAAAMEVSSHALALQRVSDVRIRVGALTNVTRDHLDFHKRFESYASAKRKLFDLAQCCVFNADDELGNRWALQLRAHKPVTTYALRAQADLRPESIDLRPDASIFYLQGRRFEVRIPGRFNVANALCAIGAAKTLGVSDELAAEGLADLERIPGRMEHVRADGIDVVVDYAHTPDALENALRTLRETAARRLIAVFGCGGDRDSGKRPQMGSAAARYADFSYVTSDNPRGEDPQSIIDQILPGIGNAPHAVRVDRREAIEAAIDAAREGDVVLIAGKGHENYQIVSGEVLPFDDLAQARQALAQRQAARR